MTVTDQITPTVPISNGFFLVDKPAGMTSHDVVDQVRKLTNLRKVGHAGTLDPAATGLLIVLVGKKATKLSDQLRSQDKTYQIEFELGRSTNTLDLDGQVTEQISFDDPRLKINQSQVEETVQSFQGTYLQQVPIYSAVKVGGRKLYQIARQNQGKIPAEVPVPSREVSISTIKLLRYQHLPMQYPNIKMEAQVSGGTYTRALVRDIGQNLGLPAVQVSLRRTSIGTHTLEQATPLDQLEVADMRTLADLQS